MDTRIKVRLEQETVKRMPIEISANTFHGNISKMVDGDAEESALLISTSFSSSFFTLNISSSDN